MAYLFTSESVSEGHPDKVADQISDAVLDNFLAQDANAHVACETLVTTGQVVIAGNWYHHDGIEVFDGKKNFHLIHETATSRSKPFIVQTAMSRLVSGSPLSWAPMSC